MFSCEQQLEREVSFSTLATPLRTKPWQQKTQSGPVHEATNKEEIEAGEDPQHVANHLQDNPDLVVCHGVTGRAFLGKMVPAGFPLHACTFNTKAACLQQRASKQKPTSPVAGAMTPTGEQVSHVTLVSVVKHHIVAATFAAPVGYGLRQKLLFAKPVISLPSLDSHFLTRAGQKPRSSTTCFGHISEALQHTLHCIPLKAARVPEFG